MYKYVCKYPSLENSRHTHTYIHTYNTIKKINTHTRSLLLAPCERVPSASSGHLIIIELNFEVLLRVSHTVIVPLACCWLLANYVKNAYVAKRRKFDKANWSDLIC